MAIEQNIPMRSQKSGQLRRADFESRLTTLLETLYEPNLAAELAGKLLEQTPNAGPARPVAPNQCMLITYADSIRAPGDAPLQTLLKFLKRYLATSLSGVHLLPFYPASSDDGFAVIDYRLVDHHLGSWEDVQALAEDYDVMMDLVINHCSRESLWFADFITGREPGKDFFITLPEESDTSAVTRPRSTPLISAVHTYAGIRHVWNTFSDDQIDLDFSNPAVLQEFVDILFFYVAQGARLIRLDAIAFLWKRLGTSCMNLPETHAVVRVLRLLLEFAGTDVQLVTETNVPHAENVSYFGTGDEAHMVYQFSLAPLLLYSYVFGDASYLTTWAARLAPPPDGGAFLNFIASHDGIGLRPLEGLVPEAGVAALVERMHARGGFVTLREVSEQEQRPYEINIALFSAFGGTPEDLPAYLGAHTLLISFQGVPALYIHSLLATTNDLELVEQTGRTRSINRGHCSIHELETVLGNADSIQTRTLTHIRHVIERRNALEAFSLDAEQTVLPSPPGVFVMRRESANQKVLVVASVSNQGQSLALAGIDLAPGMYQDLLTSSVVAVTDESRIQPYQVMWLDVS